MATAPDRIDLAVAGGAVVAYCEAVCGVREPAALASRLQTGLFANQHVNFPGDASWQNARM
jgi:hypothetical protein